MAAAPLPLFQTHSATVSLHHVHLCVIYHQGVSSTAAGTPSAPASVTTAAVPQEAAPAAQTESASGKPKKGRRLLIQEVEGSDDEDDSEEEVKNAPVQASAVPSGAKLAAPGPAVTTADTTTEAATADQPVVAAKPSVPLPLAIGKAKLAGGEKFRAGQYVDALERYEEALSCLEAAGDHVVGAHAETHVALLNNRAACMLKLGNPRACAEDCNKALAIDSENLKALLRRAVANEQRERYADAKKDYQAVIQKAPATAQAQQGLARVGRILRSLEGDDVVRRRDAAGQPVKAPASTEVSPAAADKRPATEAARPSVVPSQSQRQETGPATAGSKGAQEAFNKHKEEGNAHFKAGRLQKAVASYGQCIALDPSSGAAFNNRSLCWLRLKEFARAEADATLVLHKEPANVKAWFRRGLARRGQGELEGALEDLERALALDETNAAALKERDDVRASLTEKKKADAVRSEQQQKPETKSAKSRRLVVEEVEDEENDDEEEREDISKEAVNPTKGKTATSLMQEIPGEADLDAEAQVRNHP